MKRTKSVSKFHSETKLPLLQQSAHQGIASEVPEGQNEIVLIGPLPHTQDRKTRAVGKLPSIEVMPPESAERNQLERAFAPPQDYPPLWKQKKLLIALLGNLALIAAIYSVIFIILRG